MRGRTAGTLVGWAAVKKGRGQAGGMGRPEPYKIQQTQMQSPLLGNEEKKYITARKMFLYEF